MLTYYQDLSSPLKVTISAFTETGQEESSIIVPLQRAHTGKRVISSRLADTPCTTFSLQGFLDQLNTTLGTSYSLDNPSLSSFLEACITSRYDFGLIYSLLRKIWYTDDWSTVQDELCRWEEEDRRGDEKHLMVTGSSIQGCDLDVSGIYIAIGWYHVGSWIFISMAYGSGRYRTRGWMRRIAPLCGRPSTDMNGPFPSKGCQPRSHPHRDAQSRTGVRMVGRSLFETGGRTEGGLACRGVEAGCAHHRRTVSRPGCGVLLEWAGSAFDVEGG